MGVRENIRDAVAALLGVSAFAAAPATAPSFGDEQVEAMKAMNKRMALQLLGLDEVAGAGPEPPAD